MSDEDQCIGEKRLAGPGFDSTGLFDDSHPLFIGTYEDICLRGCEDLLGQNVRSRKVKHKIRF